MAGYERKNAKKVKCDGPTDQQTDGCMDQPTDTVTYRVACMRLKREEDNWLLSHHTHAIHGTARLFGLSLAVSLQFFLGGMCVNAEPPSMKYFPERFLRKIDFLLHGRWW